MTWAEFKAAVEAAGVKDDTEIFAIDVDPSFSTKILADVGSDGSVWIVDEHTKGPYQR